MPDCFNEGIFSLTKSCKHDAKRLDKFLKKYGVVNVDILTNMNPNTIMELCMKEGNVDLTATLLALRDICNKPGEKFPWPAAVVELARLSNEAERASNLRMNEPGVPHCPSEVIYEQERHQAGAEALAAVKRIEAEIFRAMAALNPGYKSSLPCPDYNPCERSSGCTPAPDSPPCKRRAVCSPEISLLE
jgi:hypothetical protein